ncbi:MAG: class I SAM-dependent methyltransferase [Thermoplasmatota archaeon]
MDQRTAWERWYRSNPTIWKGSLLPLPKLKKGARVLDVGCGTGNTMLQALEMGYEVVGIDISSTAVSRARERISARGFTAEVAEGDLFLLTGELGTFDCILLHHVLDNMLTEERKRAVEVCRGLLREEGIISFQDLSVNDVRFGAGEKIEENTFLKGDGLFIHFFSTGEVRGLFEGMEELSLEEVDWVQGKGPGKIRRSRISGVFQPL